VFHGHGRIILTPDHYMVVIREGEEVHIQAQEVKLGDRAFLVDHGKDR
jgi:intein/homing endonuclease